MQNSLDKRYWQGGLLISPESMKSTAICSNPPTDPFWFLTESTRDPSEHKANYQDYDMLKVRFANSDRHTHCRIIVGTDKTATVTTNWSEFRRLAKIHEGDICAFLFQGHHRATPSSHHALPLDEPLIATEVVSRYHLAF
ncbi:uncharacterized protein [Aegilops tauschii subsp. strangulata]|uniref:uncharacterized protein n=1 Tax=Aegilops tauschii subsp. strangulata TaxID=200361 RepID=UPI003CC89AF9